jgi:hypothetical protein
MPGGPLDPVLASIGYRLNNATPAQVLFAWLKSKGIVIVTYVSYSSPFYTPDLDIVLINAGPVPLW